MRLDFYTKFILTIIAIGIFLPYLSNPKLIKDADASTNLTKQDIREVIKGCRGFIYSGQHMSFNCK